MDLARLADPFKPEELSWRPQKAGIGERGPYLLAVPFIEARAIQDRLDDVCGPDGWSVAYERQDDGTVWAAITIHAAGGPVTKWDGTGPITPGPGLSEPDAAKGTLSVAFKRAAVAWGIGRYLYHVPPAWAKTDRDPKRLRFRAYKERKGTEPGYEFSWDPPALPPFACPGGSGRPEAPTSSSGYDPTTGEVYDDPKPQPPPTQSAVAPITCLQCGGPMYDNRGHKTKATSPDFACKDRRKCKARLWLDGWAKDMREAVGRIPAKTLTLEAAQLLEAKIESGDPVKMREAHVRLLEIFA